MLVCSSAALDRPDVTFKVSQVSRSLLIAVLCAIFGLSGPLTAGGPVNTAPPTGMPEILRDALMKEAVESGRWAYTETSLTRATMGKPRGATVIRFDPSRPYAEQYTPLKINGREPTEAQRKRYRQKGERRGQKLEPAVPQDDANPAPLVGMNAAPRSLVGSQSFAVDLDHVAVAAEDATSLTYELLIKGGGKEEIPVDRFQLLIRIDRERRVLENVQVKLKEALRVKLIVKVNAFESRFDFTTIDPQFPPQLTSVSGAAAVGMLFAKVGLTFDMKHTDFRRVKPYNERFGAKTGPVQLLEFLK
jgi:hypothetical protein